MRFIGNVEQDTQIRAVASGTLSNGDTVVVNSDGTVSAAGYTSSSVSESLGTPAVFFNVGTYYTAATYDANSEKVILVYYGNSGYGTAVVGSVSGSTISFGTPVVFESAESSDFSAAFDSTNNKVVIAYQDRGNSNYGTAVVGTVSGTSISFGSPVVFQSTNSTAVTAMAFDSASGKIVIAYRTTSGLSIVGTVSGTSISFGSSVQFDSGNADYISIAYDSTAEKVVISYLDGNNSNQGTAIVGTVSGTSISYGSPVVFETGATNYTATVFDSTSGKIVIAYRDAGNSGQGTAIVGTVSGTSISFGSATIFETGDISYTSMAYHSSGGKVVVSYRDGGNSNQGTLTVGTVSGTSITFDTPQVFETGAVISVSSAFDLSSGKVVVIYPDVGNSYYGTYVTYNPDYTASVPNLTAENFIGFADSGYLSGQNVGIDSTGSVNRSQSGLTAGQKYYVQNDGSLGTTAGDPSVEAGVAISATEILVKG